MRVCAGSDAPDDFQQPQPIFLRSPLVDDLVHEPAYHQGVRDMHWRCRNANDALAMAERLKPFCDDPALILLKVTTYHAGGAVDAVTMKDQRSVGPKRWT